MKKEPAEKFEKILGNDLFKSLPQEGLDAFFSDSEIIHADSGNILCRQGESGSSIFVILSGAVRLHSDTFTLAELKGGSFFGEMSLLDEGPRSLTATCTSPTEVLELSRKEFYEILGHYPEMLRNLIHVITSRFRDQNAKTIEHLRSREAELEKKVDEKTRDLQSKNEILQQTLSQLKTTQQELIQQEKLASLGQLTAGVAHEINNPINFVSASIPSLKRNFESIKKFILEYDNLLLSEANKQELEKLRREFDISETVSESDILLKGITEGASRTAEIVKGLKKFSYAQDAGMHYSDIHEGIHSALLVLSKKISDKHISLEKKFGSVPQLLCQQTQLNQLWLNILSNAIDAVDTGGIIRITTSVSEPDNMAHVSVLDNGPGMDEVVKSKVFDPFFTTKDVGKGTGLGLSISYGIVQKHEGTIELKSEKGKGAEFIVSLPLKK